MSLALFAFTATRAFTPLPFQTNSIHLCWYHASISCARALSLYLTVCMAWVMFGADMLYKTSDRDFVQTLFSSGRRS